MGSMEANLEVLRERPLWAHLQKHVTEPIMAMQMEGVLREEVEHLMGALLTNAFEVMVQDSLLFGLFFEPALMNHHCVGNTRLMLDGQHTMTVLASLPVKKNAQVKFNYGRALDPTLTRQSMLLENKFFSCRCDRCLDPTELGSHTSSLRCAPPCDGSVLPKNSVEESSWGCSKCGLEREVNEVSELLTSITIDMERLDRNNLKAVRQVVSKYSDKLHKNNRVMVELKQIVVSGLGRLPGYEMQDLTESDHKEKIIFCDEVLTVLNRVEPVLTLGRGLMLFEMHSSLVMRELEDQFGHLLTEEMQCTLCSKQLGNYIKSKVWSHIGVTHDKTNDLSHSDCEEVKQVCWHEVPEAGGERLRGRGE